MNETVAGGGHSGQSKTDAILTVLKERIAEGVYPAGTMLPPERELAAEFDVSRVTIRNVLERLETQQLVERHAGRGTYVLHRDGRTGAEPAAVGPIALVSSQLAPSVASPIGAGCSTAALAHRTQLLLCDTGGSSFAEAQAKELLHLRTLYEQGVRGVVLWWQEGDASIPWIERFVADGRAVVLIDRYLNLPGVDFVGIDDEAAAHEAVQHLLRLGHERIGCVVHSLRVSTSSDRLKGYRRALLAHGIALRDGYELLVEEGRADIGVKVAEAYLGQSEPPTAVLAVNDYVAIEIIEAMTAKGVRVPEDFAVVSFADMEVARHYRVPLTTVHQPFRSIGETAVHLIAERTATGRKEPRRVLLPWALVVRSSCGSRAGGEIRSARV